MHARAGDAKTAMVALWDFAGSVTTRRRSVDPVRGEALPVTALRLSRFPISAYEGAGKAATS